MHASTPPRSPTDTESRASVPRACSHRRSPSAGHPTTGGTASRHAATPVDTLPAHSAPVATDPRWIRRSCMPSSFRTACPRSAAPPSATLPRNPTATGSVRPEHAAGPRRRRRYTFAWKKRLKSLSQSRMSTPAKPAAASILRASGTCQPSVPRPRPPSSLMPLFRHSITDTP